MNTNGPLVDFSEDTDTINLKLNASTLECTKVRNPLLILSYITINVLAAV